VTPATFVALGKAEPLLVKRLEQLKERLQGGDEGAWTEFLEVLKVLAAILPNLRPEAGGPMLTTQEMASRLGVASKTLLRHKAEGRIRPAVERGKLLRWSGQERLG
jgi:hypothetical protein